MWKKQDWDPGRICSSAAVKEASHQKKTPKPKPNHTPKQCMICFLYVSRVSNKIFGLFLKAREILFPL